MYRPVDTSGPIDRDWLSGALAVEAGARRFTCTVPREGKVAWEDSTAR